MQLDPLAPAAAMARVALCRSQGHPAPARIDLNRSAGQGAPPSPSSAVLASTALRSGNCSPGTGKTGYLRNKNYRPCQRTIRQILARPRPVHARTCMDRSPAALSGGRARRRCGRQDVIADVIRVAMSL